MSGDTSFWAIRHAPVIGPAGVVHASDAPVDLTDEHRLGALADVLPDNALGYCSPARRTRDTAKALNLDCRIVSELREQDFGDWTGRRHDDIVGQKGGKYTRFWESPGINVPPGGESFVSQIRRTKHALDEIVGADAALIVHSGTIRAILAIALDIAAERALSFVIDPLSLTRVDRIGGGWRVTCVNSRA